MHKKMIAMLMLASLVSSVSAVEWKASWEDGSLGAWQTPEDTVNLTVLGVDEGALAAAITDGAKALKVTFTRSSQGMTAFLRLDKRADAAWFAALRNSSSGKLTADIYLPASATQATGRGAWAVVTASLIASGPKGQMKLMAKEDLTLGKENKVTLTMDYKADPDWDPKTWFAQITLAVNGSWDKASGQPELSPLFIDNITIHP